MLSTVKIHFRTGKTNLVGLHLQLTLRKCSDGTIAWYLHASVIQYKPQYLSPNRFTYPYLFLALPEILGVN